MIKSPLPRGHWLEKTRGLEPGKWMAVPNNSARCAVLAAGRNLKIKLVSKRNGKGYRIWRIK